MRTDSRSMGWSGSNRNRCSPTRSMTEARPWWSALSTRPRQRSARMRARIAGSWRRSSRRGRTCRAISSVRHAGPRRPWPPCSSARWPSSRRAGWRGGGSAACARVPCSPASRHTACGRSTARSPASFGLVLLALAHSPGWLFPRGGASRLTDALVARLRSLGGVVATGTRVASLDDVPPARAILCDVSPRPFLQLAGSRLPARYPARLGAVPVPHGRLQDRLGARRADPVDERRLPARGDGACGRHP